MNGCQGSWLRILLLLLLWLGLTTAHTVKKGNPVSALSLALEF